MKVVDGQNQVVLEKRVVEIGHVGLVGFVITVVEVDHVGLVDLDFVGFVMRV